MQTRGLEKRSTLDWASVAVGAALLMLLYLTLTNHVNLYPLNNLAAVDSLWPSTLVAWAQFAIFIGLILTRRRWLTFAALIFRSYGFRYSSTSGTYRIFSVWEIPIGSLKMAMKLQLKFCRRSVDGL